jgi:hypothetical protein
MSAPSIAIRANPFALDFAVKEGPAHLRPIALAVRDQSCDFVLVPQEVKPFVLPLTGRPLIALIGDDMFSAMGPTGFDQPSLRRLIAGCAAGAVVSSGPDERPYKSAATNAVLLRQNVVIVETRPEREIEWVNFLRDARPEIGLLICSVRENQA